MFMFISGNRDETESDTKSGKLAVSILAAIIKRGGIFLPRSPNSSGAKREVRFSHPVFRAAPAEISVHTTRILDGKKT